MKDNKIKRRIPTVLLIVLCISLVAGLALGKYAGEWKNVFDLLISPITQNTTDPSLRRYFRSNELRPASENATYAVNGTESWFTVANALDQSTVSQDTVLYTLTYYISESEGSWTAYQTESVSLTKDVYDVKKHTVSPITKNGTVYNTVRVEAKTSSFLQESIEATYTFTYSDYSVQTSASGGVITLAIDTGDMSGDYRITWIAGITPDNSDPNKMLTHAQNGPSEATVTLKHNTDYVFLFFITDDSLLGGAVNASDMVTISKK